MGRLGSFFKFFFTPFCCELHSGTVDNLQQEIAEGLYANIGKIEGGAIFSLDSQGEFIRVSEEEIACDSFFDSREIHSIIKQISDDCISTKFLYNGVEILQYNSWMIGGIRSIMEDLLSHKIQSYTFPISLDVEPLAGKYKYSYTYTMSLSSDGGSIKLNAGGPILSKGYMDKGEEGKKDRLNSSMIRNYYIGKSGITVDQFIADFDLSFARGSVIKYVCRAGKKNPDKEAEDLKKAIQYLMFEIGRLEGNNNFGELDA